MRKIKIKFTSHELIELIGIIVTTEHKLVNDILLDVKEIDMYRLDGCIKILRRLRIIHTKPSLRFAKQTVVTLDACEQLVLRYCLITNKRSVAMQNLFMIIDKAIHPSMLERS